MQIPPLATHLHLRSMLRFIQFLDSQLTNRCTMYYIYNKCVMILFLEKAQIFLFFNQYLSKITHLFKVSQSVKKCFYPDVSCMQIQEMFTSVKNTTAYRKQALLVVRTAQILFPAMENEKKEVARICSQSLKVLKKHKKLKFSSRKFHK